jgi:hypothetical protein
MVKPWKLISTHDPDSTLGEGHVRHHETLMQACNALAHDEAPYKTIIYDDGHIARDLTDGEEQLLEHVCTILGYDVKDAA